MAIVTLPRVYVDGNSLPASYYNQDLTTIVAGVNSIDNSQIAAAANIAATKIANTAFTVTGSAHFIMSGTPGAVPTVAGELQYDSTSNQFKYGNGTTTITVGQQNRAFSWFLNETLIVANSYNMQYIVPENMTVTKVYAICDTAACTVSLTKNGSTEVMPASTVNTTMTTLTSFTTPALSATDILTLNITAINTGAKNLKLVVECIQ